MPSCHFGTFRGEEPLETRNAHFVILSKRALNCSTKVLIFSFHFCCLVQNFARVKMQVTMSLSSLAAQQQVRRRLWNILQSGPKVRKPSLVFPSFIFRITWATFHYPCSRLAGFQRRLLTEVAQDHHHVRRVRQRTPEHDIPRAGEYMSGSFSHHNGQQSSSAFNERRKEGVNEWVRKGAKEGGGGGGSEGGRGRQGEGGGGRGREGAGGGGTEGWTGVEGRRKGGRSREREWGQLLGSA